VQRSIGCENCLDPSPVSSFFAGAAALLTITPRLRRRRGYVVSARLAAVAALRELSSAPTAQQLLVGIPAPAKGPRLAAALVHEGGR
jgi:hypothetical protein